MITGISIKNFKGIRDRVDVNLAPVTFLFGPNNAGKSTITDALQFLSAIVSTRSATPELYSSKWKSSFRSLVHNHDPTNEVEIGIQCSLSDSDALCFCVRTYELPSDDNDDGIPYAFRGRSVEYADPIVDTPSSLRFAVTLRQRIGNHADSKILGASITQIQIDYDGVELVCIVRDVYSESGSDKGIQSEWIVNFGHPILQEFTQEAGGVVEFLVQSKNLFPNFDDPLFQSTMGDLNRWGLDPILSPVINSLVKAAFKIAESRLKDFRTIGPMRIIPSREGFRWPSKENDAWEDGTAAWNQMAYRGADGFSDVNRWLLRLGTRCALHLTRLVDIDDFNQLLVAGTKVDGKVESDAFNGDFADFASDHGLSDFELSAFRQLHIVRVTDGDGRLGKGFDIPRLIERLTPGQVGTGISQMIPIVIAALDKSSRFWSIMQPELHLHPRMQAEMGDLFIESSKKLKNRFLVETHSENLLLRCLRRIRESSRGIAQDGLALRTEDIAIYFVEQIEGVSKIKQIGIDINGDFVPSWPDDFFEIDFFERFPDAR